MIEGFQRLLDPNAPWVDVRTGRPTREFYQYMLEFDARVRSLIETTEPVAYADLPGAGNAGAVLFVQDGLKDGESAGSGTGVLAYDDGANWVAVDTGTPVGA
jgi:hypothetical protein